VDKISLRRFGKESPVGSCCVRFSISDLAKYRAVNSRDKLELLMQPALDERPISLAEYEEIARGGLQKVAYDYYAGASWDGITLRQNRNSYDEIAIRPRMLVDVTTRDKSLELFGCKLSMPIIVAPMAFQAMAHSDGEIVMAKAAKDAETVMTASTLSNYSIEQIAEGSVANLWFQLYVYKDRELTKSLVQRAETARCKALVLTVDSPLLGRREGDVRNKFQLPSHLRIGNLIGSNIDSLPDDVAGSSLAAYIASLYDPALTWKDLAWFRQITDLPILVKGILRADDARLAIENGASGIVVSNHGGRQLDTAIATIRALPEIVEAVDGRCKVLIDGGIRRGTDVFKALALGADAVMVGRPLIWGLSVSGRAGAAHVLEILSAELDLTMALSGCPNIGSITRDMVQL
jgi:4-hydroxymandelate oxidase